MSDFNFTPSDGLKNTVSFPTYPANEAAWRKQFQDMLDQIPPYINGLNSQIDGVVVNVKQFASLVTNWKTDSLADWSPAINAAIASITKGVVYIPPGTFYFANDIVLKTGITLKGAGKSHTVLVRKVEGISIKSIGTSINTVGGGTHNQYVNIIDMEIQGGNFTANLVDFRYTDYALIENVKLFGVLGTGLYCRELFDSRINWLEIQWCGNAGTQKPCIYFTGGAGGLAGMIDDFTNNIYLTNCHSESNLWTTLKCDNNTNLINIISSKFENHHNNHDFEFMSCVGIRIIANFIACTGDNVPATTIPETIYFLNCQMLEIDSHMYYWYSHVNASPLQRFVTIDTCTDIVVKIKVFNGINNMTDSYIVKYLNACIAITEDIQYVETKGSTKYASNLSAHNFNHNVSVNGDSTHEPSLIHSTPTDYWHTGRCTPDSGGTAWRIMHQETEVFRIQNNNNIVPQKPVFFGDGIYLHLTSITPWQYEGLMYDDNSNSIPAINTYTNGAAHRVGYNSVAPVTGTWAKGDIIYNTNPTSGGYIGWVCTAAGTPGTWKSFGLIS